MNRPAIRSLQNEENELQQKLRELRATIARQRAARMGTGTGTGTGDSYLSEPGALRTDAAPLAPEEAKRVESVIHQLDELSFERANSRFSSRFSSSQHDGDTQPVGLEVAAQATGDDTPSTPDADELATFTALLRAAIS